ncbi:hypothetical protein Syun_000906 [Stephania yunnanensis]|uniref:Uncharacterized protein n=1 Tax=Stephania yunnanensis TaxID=152371 RepID=A0AAP0LD40_9MAGN
MPGESLKVMLILDLSTLISLFGKIIAGITNHMNVIQDAIGEKAMAEVVDCTIFKLKESSMDNDPSYFFGKCVSTSWVYVNHREDQVMGQLVDKEPSTSRPGKEKIDMDTSLDPRRRHGIVANGRSQRDWLSFLG